jgi:hypothetical protein
MELQVAAEAARPGARLEHLVDLDAVLGQRLLEADSFGIAEVANHGGVERAGKGGAAEQAAAEARTLLVGPVDEHQRTLRRGGGRPAGAEGTEPGEHPECTVEPAALGDGVDVRTDDDGQRVGIGAVDARPHVPRLVAFGLELELGEQLGDVGARVTPGLSPGDPLRAALVPCPPRELAQVGDHPRGVDRHQPGSRRRA